MISNKDLIFYACIAKGKTILGEFSSRECGILETLGQQCIDITPPNHLVFSHTVCNRTYTFLIHDPFVYFGIFDENFGKSECLWFLNRVKSSFEQSGSILDYDSAKSHCFQAQIDVIFGEIFSWDRDFDVSLKNEYEDSRRSSIDSSMEKTVGVAPLLMNPSKGLMKKKKRLPSEREANINGDVKDMVNMENKVDVCDDMSMQKMGLYAGDNRQKAKQIWKKHVWIVLVLDLFICAALFGIWLWVCRGFQCIDG